MRKIVFICILTFAVWAIPQQCRAVHPLALKLLNQCAFDSDFGNPVDTYEDVDPITNIGPTSTDVGPLITNNTLNQFQKDVSDDVGQALIDKINSTSGRVIYNTGFLHFMKKFMYIQGGGYDEYGVWHSGAKLEGFPVDYDPGNQPHVMSYYLCLKPAPPVWYFIPPVSLAPNGKSCHSDDVECDYPPCVKAVKEDNDGNGNDDDNGNGITGEVITPAQHNQPTNNVYKDLKGYLLSIKQPGVTVDKDQSGIKFNMTFKDRTPPIIDGCIAGEFPEIGIAPDEATTGDWFKVDGLTISDNDSDFIGTCLCLGKIDGYPADDEWMNAQDWVPQLPFQKIPNNGTTQNVIIPNTCHGVMKYTIFAWDQHGLLNPGDPNIVPDRPEICYGLQDPPGSANLSRDPGDAKPWPLRVASQTGSVEDIPIVQINPSQRRGTGKINVKDNDLPNLAIRIRSVKDGSTMFFPPVIEPLDLPIFSCSDYKPASGLDEPNAKDYEDFVGNPVDAIFTSELASDAEGLYFKILDVQESPVMPAAEISFLERFKNPSSDSDYDFIKEHFRLEDYQESDTELLSGADIISDEATFGKRNGIGGEVVAVLNEPLQEDVEYLISIWMDDNVKWATKSPTGAILGDIHPIPTGIDDGEISIVVPNQVPAFTFNRPIDKTRAVSEEIRVVFREPTIDSLGPPPTTGAGSISYFHNGKFPFIEVWVKDYSGLQRKVKLYLRIHNENPDIRIIESEHGKQG